LRSSLIVTGSRNERAKGQGELDTHDFSKALRDEKNTEKKQKQD